MSYATSLFVFAHLDSDFVPAGILTLTEQNSEVLASEFAYGLKYLDRANALEIDPLSLPLANKSAQRGKRLKKPAQAPGVRLQSRKTMFGDVAAHFQVSDP